MFPLGRELPVITASKSMAAIGERLRQQQTLSRHLNMGLIWNKTFMKQYLMLMTAIR
jgi:hypothetical protein